MSQQLDYKFLEHVCMLCCQIGCSNNLTCKNLCSNVGSLTWYKPLSCDTTNYKSRRTSREWTPCEMESHNNSIMTLYSAALFDEGHKQTPLEENTLPIGV